MNATALPVRFGGLTPYEPRPNDHSAPPASRLPPASQGTSKNTLNWSTGNIWSSTSFTPTFGALGRDVPNGKSLQAASGTQARFTRPRIEVAREDEAGRPKNPGSSSISDLWKPIEQPWPAAPPSSVEKTRNASSSTAGAHSSNDMQSAVYDGAEQWPFISDISAGKRYNNFATNAANNAGRSFNEGRSTFKSTPDHAEKAHYQDSNWHFHGNQNQNSMAALSAQQSAVPDYSRPPYDVHAARSVRSAKQQPMPTTPEFIKNNRFLLKDAHTKSVLAQGLSNDHSNASSFGPHSLGGWLDSFDMNPDPVPWNKPPNPSTNRARNDRMNPTPQFDCLSIEERSLDWAVETNFRPSVPRSQPWFDLESAAYLPPQNIGHPSTDNINMAHYTYDRYLNHTAEIEDHFVNFQLTSQKAKSPAMVDVYPRVVNNHINGAQKSYPSNELVRRPDLFQMPQDFNSNQFLDRTGQIQKQEQNQWLSESVLAARMRGHYMSQLEYGLRGLALNGCQPYSAASPLIMQPRLPTTAFPHDLDSDHVVRSALLDEFRGNLKNNSRRYELREIYNHIVEFAGDQHGSRFIQTKLETANSEEKERVFRELIRDAVPLMKDVFGNYVIQKMFEHGDQNHKKILVNKMKGQVLDLTTQIYGCRVVQKALQHVLVDQQISIISELERHVLKCVRDQHGNHVIQRIIELVPFECIHFVVDAFVGQAHHLATHPYGCRVVQRLLEYSHQPAKANILKELHTSASTLIGDQYGNYVIQNVVEQGTAEDRAKIFAVVKSNLIPFSRQKFASNVVEKSLLHGTDEQRREIMHLLSAKNNHGESAIPLLIRDSFGNYVIQKLLKTLDPADRASFNELLEPEVFNACRAPINFKQANNVAKQMHVCGSALSYDQHVRPALPALETDSSAMSTPPLTADSSRSPLSSSVPSTIGEGVLSHQERESQCANSSPNDAPLHNPKPQ